MSPWMRLTPVDADGRARTEQGLWLRRGDIESVRDSYKQYDQERSVIGMRSGERHRVVGAAVDILARIAGDEETHAQL